MYTQFHFIILGPLFLQRFVQVPQKNSLVLPFQDFIVIGGPPSPRHLGLIFHNVHILVKLSLFFEVHQILLIAVTFVIAPPLPLTHTVFLLLIIVEKVRTFFRIRTFEKNGGHFFNLSKIFFKKIFN